MDAQRLMLSFNILAGVQHKALRRKPLTTHAREKHYINLVSPRNFSVKKENIHEYIS
jgi:hypothetical protein